MYGFPKLKLGSRNIEISQKTPYTHSTRQNLSESIFFSLPLGVLKSVQKIPAAWLQFVVD